MITAYTNYDGSTDYLCVSSDTKPVATANSLLYELDTKKLYYYNSGWLEVGFGTVQELQPINSGGLS